MFIFSLWGLTPSAGTTYQLSVYQFLNTAENLLNQSVTATYMIL